MKHPCRALTTAALVCSSSSIALLAYDLPGVNLGFTSFLDGGPPAGPGFYGTEYVQYYHSDTFRDQDGDEIPFPDPDLNVLVSLTQFIYQDKHRLPTGANWGIDVIIPVVWFDLSYGASGPFPQDNGAGLGDILVGPFIQWTPIMGAKGPIFMHRIEFQCLTPTGKYDADRELNPGANVFSFNPYWAGTLFLTPRWSTSTRVHYLWNDENDEPNRADAAAGATTSQAGQAIHLNFSTEYEIWPKHLHVGLNGYYLTQITDTKVDGQDVDDRREQVLGLGPGAVYHFSQDDHLFFNVYFETLTENRTEGQRFNLRFVHHF